MHFHSHDTHCHHDDDPLHPERRVAKIKRLQQAMWLTGIYFWAELIGGWWSGSLALLADSGHMFTDMAGIGLAAFASWISTVKTSPQQTYGLYRAEVLAAFLNGLVLIGMSVWIIFEAWHRFSDPSHIHGLGMLWIAIGGLGINLLVMKSLHGDHQHDLNVKGAYLHVLGDVLGSVGTIVAAGLVTWFGILWADPVISAIIAILIMASAFRLVWDATRILLEMSPAHVDLDALERAITDVDGVLTIHDLHVWTISSHRHALSAHVTVEKGQPHPPILSAIQIKLSQEFGLNHVTLQLEPPGFVEDTHQCG